MNNPNGMELIAQSLSSENGRSDALAVALVGMLHALRKNREVAVAVANALEAHYLERVGQPWNPHYIEGFETIRDYLLEHRG